MGNRFYYGMPSTQAFQAMNALDDDVQAKNTAATIAAQAAASSAAQAGNARDAALAAWQASTAPNEQLAAISKQFHTGAVVDVFLYDTSRDSDGGAWRKRCKHTSWENETLVPGKWLGQQANTAAAFAAGGANGDYYQHATLGNFFMLTSQGGADVYRGNTREFPALALIVVETARVVIYDATQPTLPMWMVFAGLQVGVPQALSNGALSSVFAVDSKVLIGLAGTAGGVAIFDYAADKGERINSSIWRYNGVLIADRNIVRADIATGTGQPILLSNVNDIAAISMPDAPMDPATGLPTPTIAVATAGGISVIKHDGTVVNSGAAAIDSIRVTSRGTIQYSYNGNTTETFNIAQLSAGFGGTQASIVSGATFSSGSKFVQNPLGFCPRIERDASAGNNGLIRHKLGNAAEKTMIAAISNAYSSGWQVGDSRGAWLADTVAGTISASGELVTNGTFNTDTSGWTPGVTTTISAVGGAMRIQNPANTTTYGGACSGAIAVIPGKWYTASFKTVGGTTSAVLGKIGTGQFTNDVSGDFIGSATFLAPSSGFVYFCFAVSPNVSGAYGDVDNVSLKLAEPDRSVKNTGLIVNGSLTKSAVATGAQLVAYSGFSAGNYLEQAYSANLDFGTGDFCYMGWVKITDISSYIGVLHRSQPGQGGGLYIQINGVTGTVAVYCSTTNSYSMIATSGSSAKVPLNIPTLIEVSRASGTLKIKLNGVTVSSVSSGENLTYVGAMLRLGCQSSGNEPVKGWMALWRASATAPSDDQSAQIYRDELALFQPAAQCTIDGTNVSVTSMAYDDTADVLHVGTSWGRSGFRGLQRIESAMASVGAVTAISAGQGACVTGGASGARYQQPAIALRDELRRKNVRTAGTREAMSFDFDSTAGMTDFTLPPGWSVKDVFVAGARKRLGATKDYVVIFDGYRDTARFAVSPGAAWVQVVAARSDPG